MGLHYSSVMDARPAEVFAWHERPGALPRLVPPWQPLKVAEEAQSLAGGRAVLQLPGRVRWVAQHSGDDPPHRFVDELVSLPLHWRHTHSFETVEGGGTRVIDDVETPVPGSLLRQTFRYRHHQLAGDLAAHRERGAAWRAAAGGRGHRLLRPDRLRPVRLSLHRRAPRDPPGATSPSSIDSSGPGSRATRSACAGGHRRRRASRGGVHRRPFYRRPQAAGPRQPGGPHLGACPCHGRHAGRPADPRVRVGHRLLRERARRRVAHGGERARHGVPGGRGRSLGGGCSARRRCGCASGARADGNRPVRPWSEPEAPSPSLLGRPRWTSLSGIAMGVMDRPRRSARCLRAGARRRRAGRPAERGAPGAVTNAEYASTLARVMRRPALLKVPAFGPQMLLGAEGAREMVQASQRVAPARLVAAGHVFRHPSLEVCLRHQLGHIAVAPFEEEWRNA